MARKRRYGTGTVYQVKSGAKAGRWVGVYEAREAMTATGGRKRVTVTATSESQCRTKLNAKIADIEEHGLKVSSGVTVKVWAETEWLPRYEKRASPKTYANAASNVNRYIIPTIGKVEMEALTARHLRKVYDAIYAANTHRATKGLPAASRCHAVLSSLIEDAEREGVKIQRSARVVEPPAVTRSTREDIPLADALLILQAAQKRGDRARWVAAFLQGTRPAEARGLTWDRVDFDRGLIDLDWQLQSLPYRVARKPESGFRTPQGYEMRHLVDSYHLVRPKTSAGERVVPLVPWMRAELLRLRDDPDNANPYNLVFWRESGRHGLRRPMPIAEKIDGEQWRDLQREAEVAHESGRPYALYEARHTCATLLLQEGVDEAIVKWIMGHTSIDTTRIYQHVNAKQARKALDQIASMLGLDATTRTAQIAATNASAPIIEGVIA